MPACEEVARHRVVARGRHGDAGAVDRARQRRGSRRTPGTPSASATEPRAAPRRCRRRPPARPRDARRTSRRGTVRGARRPTTAARSRALTSHLPCPFDRDDRDAGRVRQREHLLPVEHDRATRLHREGAPAHLDDRADRVRAHRRQVEAHVLGRLAGLHHDDVAIHQLSGAPDRRVRALDALDRHDGAAAHDHALADVELPDHLGGAEAEVDVGPLLGRRAAAARQHAFGGHDLLQVQRRLDDADALALELLRERPQQDVVAQGAARARRPPAPGRRA